MRTLALAATFHPDPPMKLKPLVLACACALALPTYAGVVISQVYGGGGNSGATLRNDFIELFNAGDTAAVLDGLSVQYASSTGTSWQRTPIAGVLQPGQYYLVQQAAGANTAAAALPTPDAIGTLALSGTTGKVALVNGANALACGASCASDLSVLDFVGFGTANDSETAPAPVISNTTAALRAQGGCSDTNNNSADFTAGAPLPRNSTTQASACGGTGNPTPTPTPTPSPTPTPNPTPGSVRIHDIQGSAHRSPLDGQSVANVPGIVTLVVSNGFYFQDEVADNDPRTSEGVFVFTSSAPAVAVGDKVLVSGKVSEFRPGGSSGTNNLTVTELASPQVSKLSSGNALPPGVLLGTQPNKVIWQGAAGDVETAAALDLNNGLDFYEALEGMRVEIANAVAVGPSNSYGETPLVANAGIGADVRTPRGGLIIRADDFNPERVIVEAGSVTPPRMNVGDGLARVVGVLDYNFGNVMLRASEVSPLVSGGLQQEVTRKQRTEELAVASFNVENLSPRDDAAKFARLAQQVVSNLQSPDIVGLMEMQDNNGATDDGVVSASETFARLIAAISAAGGPAYSWRSIDPVNDQDGGEPGGNIRVGFLYNPARVQFVDRAGGTATSAVAVTSCGNAVCLSASPGRIQPADAAFNSSRKPLVGEFVFAGQTVFVIANHWNSKGGDQPLSGRYQPPVRSSEVQRNQQARLVADFVTSLTSRDPQARLIVLGDLNDFQFSDAVGKLKATGLVDLIETLPENERYTYVFEGNSQVLDHILASANLAARAEYDAVHTNSEFADQTSDHDPEVARFAIGPVLPGCFANWTAGVAYTAGQRASIGTVNYEAKWWTQGENPQQSGQWEVWKKLGTCTTEVAQQQVSPPQPATTVTDWIVGNAYALGDRVRYNGLTYLCTVAHTAQGDWQPGVAPSLWQQQQ
ncbi:hypothetical protein IGB42_02426 [Andreprevotia sp. IGB-42]|nr:hypothetical protein IGB42_02426 [Andreprevotia sp. IGB-42]